MPTFGCSTEIRASAEELFALTQDYTRRLDWDPFLKEARLVNAEAVAVGVRAWCVSHLGLGMETEYVALAPPHRVAVKMTRGPCLLALFAASWRFEALLPNCTRVTFRYHLTTRPRLARFLLDPLLTFALRYEMRKRLSALKAMAEARDPLEPPRAAVNLPDKDCGSD